MNKYGFCALLLTGILLIAVLGTKLYTNENKREESTIEDKTVIVTSFYPMYVATANLLEGLEDEVVLENLSQPQGGCLHNYQLTTGDMQLLSTADVLIINGGGAENFLEDVLKAYPDLIIIEACEPLEEAHSHEEEVHQHEEEHSEDADEEASGSTHDHEGHEHSELAHIWMCPSDYKEQVAYIGEQLEDLLPAYEGVIAQNTKDYQEQITGIQMEMEQLHEISEGKAVLVILLHEAFEPFCEELGYEVLHTINLDEDTQVSSGELAEVISLMETHPETLILAEELYGQDLAETIQREINVTVVYLSPLTRGELTTDGYITGMMENIQLLKEALLP